MKKLLTHKEEAIMQILWRLEKAFIKDIRKEMGKEAPPYNTVSSTVRKLVKEGIIGFEDFGSTHRYFPILKKEAYRKSYFRQFLENYFGGSPEKVLSYFVNEEKVNPKELDELLNKIIEKDKSQHNDI